MKNFMIFLAACYTLMVAISLRIEHGEAPGFMIFFGVLSFLYIIMYLKEKINDSVH